MISRWLLAPVLLCGQAYSSDYYCDTDPCEEQTQTSIGIQGIFLTERMDDIIPEGRPEMTGIQMMDIEIPGGAECLGLILEPYLGREVTKETVIEIKQQIMTYYVDQGMRMLGVSVPSQITKGGVVQFLITKKSFGSPIYIGEGWYDCEKLGCYLDVCPNQEICEDTLLNDLAWLNFNPFRYARMRYVQSDERDVVDIEFEVKTRRAIRFYERADNTGFASSGYGRFYSGVILGNMFNRGDILSLEYQFSNKFKRLQEFTGNYTCYLPWQHIFSLYGMYASVKPIVPFNSIHARAYQVKPRYTIIFKPLYTPFQQRVTFGFDYKYTNSSILNLSTLEGQIQPLPGALRREINITQLLLEYTLFHHICNHDISFDLQFYASPFKFLPHQSNQAYNAQRPHSKPLYCYLYVTAGDVYTVCNTMTISLLLRGQVASRTLPAAELFSIGGYDTVRGYHEAEVTGDNGFIANLELRTLPFCVTPKNRGKILFLAFLDFGLSNNWNVTQSVVPGAKRIPHTQYLLGIGPGLRYSINPNFQFRCDYGFKLHKLFRGNLSDNQLLRGSGQVHLGALASF
jgi:hemolysin activation/secretion protein